MFAILPGDGSSGTEALNAKSPPLAVLFVCLGNICRSPLAEAAFRQAAQRIGLEVTIDSAGTGAWHVGSAPDPRAQAVATRHDASIAELRARQVQREDFARFSHIFALDRDNLKALRQIAPPGNGAALSLLLDLVPGKEGQGVRDPYFGDEAGFEETWTEVAEAARRLAQKLTQD